MKNFNLTTQKGVMEAYNYAFSEYLDLIPRSIKSPIERIFASPQEQQKLVEDIIKKGKEEGVDSIEIELKDKGGINLDMPIEGCEIKGNIGKNQEYRINVKYK